MPRDAIILGAERLNGRAPIAWVYYEPPDPTIKQYIVPWIGPVEDPEELADLLAEGVERRWPGHGEIAFKAALEQLGSTDFVKEWLDLKKKVAAYKRWGGQPPAAVMMPDESDPKAPWKLVVPQNEGLGPLHIMKVRPEVTRDFPRPEEGVNAYRDEFGWKAKPPQRTVEERRWERGRLAAKLRGLRERRITV